MHNIQSVQTLNRAEQAESDLFENFKVQRLVLFEHELSESLTGTFGLFKNIENLLGRGETVSQVGDSNYRFSLLQKIDLIFEKCAFTPRKLASVEAEENIDI